MGKYFKLRDTTMVIIGTMSHAIARIVFALAEVPWLFYLGASIASFGPVVAPVLRSMSSKLVPHQEKGKNNISFLFSIKKHYAFTLKLLTL